MRGVCSDKHCRFMTILDNVLNVNESAGGEELAGRPHSHRGGLLGGTGGGLKNGTMADFAVALQR